MLIYTLELSLILRRRLNKASFCLHLLRKTSIQWSVGSPLYIWEHLTIVDALFICIQRIVKNIILKELFYKRLLEGHALNKVGLYIFCLELYFNSGFKGPCKFYTSIKWSSLQNLTETIFTLPPNGSKQLSYPCS